MKMFAIVVIDIESYLLQRCWSNSHLAVIRESAGVNSILSLIIRGFSGNSSRVVASLHDIHT